MSAGCCGAPPASLSYRHLLGDGRLLPVVQVTVLDNGLMELSKGLCGCVSVILNVLSGGNRAIEKQRKKAEQHISTDKYVKCKYV